LHGEKRSFDISVEYFVVEILRNRTQGEKCASAGIGENDIDSSLCLDLFVETIKE